MNKTVIYGYARVSTMKQKLERQIDNIKREFPGAVIITEKYTGTKQDRPEWNKLVEQIKKESAKGTEITLVFDEVSRMSRNAAEGFQDYKMLYDMGIRLVFIKERHIDTDNFRQALQSKVPLMGGDIDILLKGVNEYLMKLAERQIEIAFQTAQAEVDYLHQRTKEGVLKAQAKGKQIGRKEGTKAGKDFRESKKAIKAKEKILEHSKDFNGKLSDTDCIAVAGVSRNTFYKLKKQLKEM
ncbi:MAG: recombinase family protein [Oscillospiraceae bacterium]|nr:recombinase family protein [Oscillospiraceae bacterium]